MKWPFFSKSEKVMNEIITKRKPTADSVSDKQIFRMQEDLKTLRVAFDSADNKALYNREDLHRIYRRVALEPHLRSQWGTRKLKTMEKEFAVVDKAGNEVEELTEILESQWFMAVMDEILESKAWGFSLIEFGPVDTVNKKFLPYRVKSGRIYDAITSVDRDYVKPEFGFIGMEPSASQGVSFFDGEFAKTTLFVGKHHDYGFFESAARYILFKENCIENWSEWAEVFGMDIRVGKTDAEGDAKKKFLDTLKKMGSSGYGVIDKEDEIDYQGTSRTDAYKVYEALMDTVDKNISKLVFGQDVISNNTGQVVGKVGENVSNLYGDSDAKFVARIVNKEVFPKLTAFGIGNFENSKFKWDNSEKLSLKDNSEVDYKISQMGYKIAKDYLENKYNIKLEEMPAEPAPTKEVVKAAQALKALYAGSME